MKIIDLEKLVRNNYKIPEHAVMEADVEGSTVSYSYDKLDIFTTPKILGTATYINDTELPATQQFTDSTTTSASYSWTLAEGTSCGITASVSIGIKWLGFGASATAQKNFSSTETKSQTTSKSQTWAWNASIPVPPRTRVEAQVIIQEGTYSPKFKAVIRFKGKLRYFWCSDTPLLKPDGSKILPFTPCWQTFKLGEAFAKFPHEKIKVIDDSTVDVTIAGQFHGVQGINYTVEVHQFDLEADSDKPVSINQIQNASRLGIRIDTSDFDSEITTPVAEFTNVDDGSHFELMSLDHPTIGAPPDGIRYRILYTTTLEKLTPLCGFNDLMMPNIGRFKIETRLYEQTLNGNVVSTWTEQVETFVECVSI